MKMKKRRKVDAVYNVANLKEGDESKTPIYPYA